MKTLLENKMALAGFVLLCSMLFLALAGPLVYSVSPYDVILERNLSGPAWEHPLGCDQLGRDILARIFQGTRISLSIGLIVTAVSLILGTSLGLFAAYKGGWTDTLFTWLFDTAMAIPGLLLAIAIIAVLGPDTTNLIIALCAMGWVGYARLARGLTLKTMSEEYIAAAKVSGAKDGRIMFVHILPNIAGPLIIQGTIGMAGVIITESTLSFLGLSGEVDSASWGSMLNDGLGYILVAPHLTIFPGLAIIVTVLALNFIGDGLRDKLDPRNDIYS